MLTVEKLDELLSTMEISEDELASRLNRLIIARHNLFDTSEFSKVEPGSLVYIPKHKEVGFLVGPLDVFGKFSVDDEIQRPSGKQLKTTERLRYEIGTHLVITVPDKDAEDPTKYLRIRYVKEKDLVSLGIDLSEVIKPRYTSDLSKFCGKQCIMECSEDCVLWKYKKNK